MYGIPLFPFFYSLFGPPFVSFWSLYFFSVFGLFFCKKKKKEEEKRTGRRRNTREPGNIKEIYTLVMVYNICPSLIFYHRETIIVIINYFVTPPVPNLFVFPPLLPWGGK